MTRPWIILALMGLSAWEIGGCVNYIATPLTAHDPRIVTGDERDVSIQTEGWSLPGAQARRHCATFGKTALYQGAIRYNGEYDDDRLHFYKCV